MSAVTSLSATVNEEQLVQRLVARDGQALRHVYDHYGPNLLAVIRRLVHDQDLAQDVLQEGLLKVWLGIASYDVARGRLFTWMVRVCCNQAVDALRTPRQRLLSRSSSLQDSADAQNRPAASFKPEHIGLRELTLCLKPRQREIIELLYFGGCTQTEAAEELGIPVATVKTRARAALAVLARWAH